MTLSDAGGDAPDADGKNIAVMEWQEVKDFLDHMWDTCIKDRQALKLEVRMLRAENERLRALWAKTTGCES